MKSTLNSVVRVCIFGLGLYFWMFTAADGQTPGMVADVATRINRERTSRGMIPYAVNSQLMKAAQAHADDVMRSGVESHTGSDGSTVRDRVKRAGYAAYSWGYRVGENWARYFDAPTAMRMWMDSPPHNHNILHPVYREFGIGIAPYKGGGYIFVVDFGAEPNVLPIFASGNASGEITLVLSNENYASTGDGANTIGLATQVQISGSPDFTNAPWQIFSTRIAWTFPPGSTGKMVYVNFRDAKGRTLTSSGSIVPEGSFGQTTAIPTLRPSPTKTPRPVPTITRGAAIVLSPTYEPTDPPSPTATVPSDATATPEEKIATALNPDPLRPDSAESVDDRTDNPLNPIAFGLFGAAIFLGVFAGVKFYVRRKIEDA
jgi:hypothetical protein